MKIIVRGQDARERLKQGIDIVADCVKVTLGPAGKNAVIGRRDITPIITNDGVTIARNIVLEDEIAEQGAMIVKEASSLTDKNAGDGTTTTTVLLQAIANELFDKIRDNGSIIGTKIDTIKLKKQVDAACAEIVSKLKEKAKPIKAKDVYDVALVSVEYDWLARMLADMFKEIGVDGYVSVEDGLKNEYEVFKGIELKTGFYSEYFINSDRQCVLENPKILVTNQKLDTLSVIPLVEEAMRREAKSIVLIAPDFEKDLLNRLVATKLSTGYTILPLKLPTFDKDDLLKDVSALTESKFMDKNTFGTLKDFAASLKFEVLGTVEKIVSDETKTILIGGQGDVSERVSEIKKKIKKTESVFDKDELEKRLAYLSGGIAKFKVWATSDFEKTYLKLKVEDAINAIQWALKEGVVKGGGLALKEVADELPDNMLANAIRTPYSLIQESTGGIEIPDTVVDPLKVTVSAVESACSLAGILITTETVIADKNESQDKNED